jgi:hypothetical protein
MVFRWVDVANPLVDFLGRAREPCPPKTITSSRYMIKFNPTRTLWFRKLESLSRRATRRHRSKPRRKGSLLDPVQRSYSTSRDRPPATATFYIHTTRKGTHHDGPGSGSTHVPFGQSIADIVKSPDEPSSVNWMRKVASHRWSDRGQFDALLTARRKK